VTEMQDQNKNQKQPLTVTRQWVDGYRLVTETRKIKTEKNNTGEGQKSTGKRKRCTIEKCQAFASPSGSGFCSAHELKFTPVGARVADAAKYKCKTPACGNLPEGDIEFCRGCAKKLYDNTLNPAIIHGLPGTVDDL
jgi:hypothetical protein